MSGRFDILETPIQGLKVITRKPMGDARRSLERIFCADELQPLLSGKGVAQINLTFTVRRGTVRGMHFQRPPHAETKLVNCLRGEVFDVAVDLRQGSPTFMRWHGEVLTAANHRTMVIPDAFAHGFQSLTENCEMLYLHTAAYWPDAEDGLNADDPSLAIRWPEPIAERSPRDAALPLVRADFRGLTV